MRNIFIFLLVVVSSCLQAQLQFQKLENEIDSIVKTNNLVPGICIAIVDADSIKWTNHIGYANIKNKSLVTDSTLFCIGSCTKSFTGIALLKLIEEGKINEFDLVTELVPELNIENPWEHTHPLQIIHLVEHTCGFEDSHPNWFYFNEPLLTIKEALESKQHLLKVRWKPGTRYCYSSPGFTLAGYIIEKVSNEPLGEYMKSRIFKPIGMDNTVFGNSNKYKKNVAIGYDKKLNEYPKWFDFDEPAGGIYSSSMDMALFVKMLLNDGKVGDTEIINKKSFERLARPETGFATKNGLELGYSFGVGTTFRNRMIWHGHGGAVPGFLSSYYYCPNKKVGFVIMQNQFDMTFEEAAFTSVWKYMKDKISEEDENNNSNINNTCNLKKYEGYYVPKNQSIELGATMSLLFDGVSVFVQNDTLFTQKNGGKALAYFKTGDSTFKRKYLTISTGVLNENADGKMVYATKNEYYERIPRWKVLVGKAVFLFMVILMLSILPYWIIKGIALLIRKLKGKTIRVSNILIKLLPLLAVVSIIIGVIPFISQPTIIELGQKNFNNILLFISTTLFGLIMTVNIIQVLKHFKRIMKLTTKIYFTCIAISGLILTIFLVIEGVIGMRLWL